MVASSLLSAKSDVRLIVSVSGELIAAEGNISGRNSQFGCIGHVCRVKRKNFITRQLTDIMNAADYWMYIPI